MTDLARTDPPAITDEQRDKLLAIVAKDPTIGTVGAAKQAGLTGTKGEIRTLLEPLAEEIREARGWNIRAVEDVDWKIALDKDHPSGDRSRSRLLKAYGGPQFRDRAELEVSGGMEVTNPDVAEAIERFTAAVVSLAAGSTPELAAGDADGRGESRPGLPVGRVAGTP